MLARRPSLIRSTMGIKVDRRAISGRLKVKSRRGKTCASLPLDAIRRLRDTPIWNWRRGTEMPVMQKRTLCAARDMVSRQPGERQRGGIEMRQPIGFPCDDGCLDRNLLSISALLTNVADAEDLVANTKVSDTLSTAETTPEKSRPRI
jgi:hypothetical protein